MEVKFQFNEIDMTVFPIRIVMQEEENHIARLVITTRKMYDKPEKCKITNIFTGSLVSFHEEDDYNSYTFAADFDGKFPEGNELIYFNALEGTAEEISIIPTEEVRTVENITEITFHEGFLYPSFWQILIENNYILNETITQEVRWEGETSLNEESIKEQIISLGISHKEITINELTVQNLSNNRKSVTFKAQFNGVVEKIVKTILKINKKGDDGCHAVVEFNKNELSEILKMMNANYNRKQVTLSVPINFKIKPGQFISFIYKGKENLARVYKTKHEIDFEKSTSDIDAVLFNETITVSKDVFQQAIKNIEIDKVVSFCEFKISEDKCNLKILNKKTSTEFEYVVMNLN